MLASSLLLLTLTATAGEPGPSAPAATTARADLDALLARPRRHPGDDPYDDGDPEYQGTDKPGWLLLSTLGAGVVAAVAGGRALSMKGRIAEAPPAEAEDLVGTRNAWGYTGLGALGLTAVGATTYAVW